ncbi:beta-galactosidase BoGH2A [Abditibacteriota bacterium]|nr:beta-galactosidase BoGH2A [Abditibacteriota bacterium]
MWVNSALPMNKKSSLLLCATLAASVLASLPAMAWAPKKAPIETKWAALVNPEKPLPEYPRPQLVRKDWLNLNGIWEYQSGAADDAVPAGKKLTDEICVPYPVESALSGVMEHHDRLWYRRNFTVPSSWKNKQVKINFGAVDYESEVYVNGKSLGVHTGGYVPFSYDVTPYLKGTGPQELIVRVFDPTEKGGQPRGKQTTDPGGIMYTPTTGIWQTVWLEPVAKTSINSLHMIPDVDNSLVRITVAASNATGNTRVTLKVKDGNTVIKTVQGAPNTELSVPVENPKLWTPNNPALYSVDISLTEGKKQVDSVGSYFGMRKISVGMSNGEPKLLLNNQFVFQMGPLDQGFWPEGLYTAPTDDALKFDIEMEKKFGFNMVRKHIKIEPARWYYWTDKLGILVWQDMPSPNSYIGNPPPIDKPAYEKQLNEVIKTLWNVPSIVMWVVFNEGQARHDTAYIVDVAKKLDPSRLVNRDSGGGYEDDTHDGTVGDVDDVHSYPPPAASGASPNQARVCGEYGGIGFIIKGHTWKSTGWGYTTINSAKELEELYGEFTGILKNLQDTKALSAAVYTEITDVEIESNGLMTYDRVIKCDPDQIALANHFKYPLPTYRTIVPTSETTSQTWKYTFSKPSDDWFQNGFDATGWQSGPGGFGTANTPGIGKLGTEWNTPDIWLRRTFNPGNLAPIELSQLLIRDYHDEDLEVYINGVLAYKKDGYTSSYESKPMTPEGLKAIVPGGENTLAVHCHQTGGGQYVDVGISQRMPPKAP